MQTDDQLHVTDLADGRTLGTVAADPDHARTALEASDAVAPELRDTTVVERAAWCEEITAGLLERKSELAEIVVREAGKPISSARSEVDAATERFRRSAEEARNIVSTSEYREGSTDGHEG